MGFLPIHGVDDQVRQGNLLCPSSGLGSIISRIGTFNLHLNEVLAPPHVEIDEIFSPLAIGWIAPNEIVFVPCEVAILDSHHYGRQR